MTGEDGANRFRAPGVLFRRQIRWTQWARWLPPVLSSGWGPEAEVSLREARFAAWRFLSPPAMSSKLSSGAR
jgi:hypothetical protein